MNHKRIGRDLLLIKADLQRLQRHRPVLRSRGRRNLILRHGLHWNVVRPARNQTFESRLSRTGWFTLLLDVKYAVVRIGWIYWNFIVGVNGGGVRRLPEHQKGGFVPEPHDELSGCVGLYKTNIIIWILCWGNRNYLSWSSWTYRPHSPCSQTRKTPGLGTWHRGSGPSWCMTNFRPRRWSKSAASSPSDGWADWSWAWSWWSCLVTEDSTIWRPFCRCAPTLRDSTAGPALRKIQN